MNRSLFFAVVMSGVAAAGGAHAQAGVPNMTTPNTNPNTGSITPKTNPQGMDANSNTSGAEAAVKEQLRSAGFTGVHMLTRNPDGTWQGRAMKGNQEIAVMIDAGGNIIQQ